MTWMDDSRLGHESEALRTRPSQAAPASPGATGKVYVDYRRRSKRDWERALPRGECPCGATLGIGSMRRGAKHCMDCHTAALRQARDARRRLITEMWTAAKLVREIAVAIGWTEGATSVELHRMRTDGWPLPRRQKRAAR